jgi:DNA-binding GntR family transcriptional regulator
LHLLHRPGTMAAVPQGALGVSVHKAYYDIVRDWLTDNINVGMLPPGTRLTVAAVADRLSVSRSPVKRALDLLEQDGRLSRDGGQGYVVFGARSAPQSTNLHTLPLHLPHHQAALVRPSWEAILDAVSEAVMDCIPFGMYQISETDIGHHFNVSRTVTREALARLHDRGVITKDRASHWIAGPLSARMLDDAHELRRLLEPAAIVAACPLLEYGRIGAMAGRVARAMAATEPLPPDLIDDLEADLHERCLSPLRNRRMAVAVGQVQLGRVVNRLFDTYIGQHDETAMLREHQSVLHHLALGDATGAGQAMRFHLDAGHQRTRDRLKVLSVFSEPAIAPYLSRII